MDQPEVSIAEALGQSEASIYLALVDQPLQHREPLLHVVFQRVDLRGDGGQDLQSIHHHNSNPSTVFVISHGLFSV